MRALGRSLQLLGLVLPLVGLLHALSGGARAEAWELGLLAAGVCLFVAGWSLQRRAR